MEASLYVSKTGLDAQQMRMTVISNNLANVNTVGYKRDRAVFEDLLYQNIRQAGGSTGGDNQSPTGLMIGTGVRIVATEKTHTQGSMIQTKNALDLAIQGEGMSQSRSLMGHLPTPEMVLFKLSVDRELVTSNGMQLQPVITIPQNAESISIGEDGTVSIQPYGNAEEQVIGQLLLTRFVNYADSSPWVRTCTEKHPHRVRQLSGYQMKTVPGGLPKARWRRRT